LEDLASSDVSTAELINAARNAECGGSAILALK
jgi:hypothetical protein